MSKVIANKASEHRPLLIKQVVDWTKLHSYTKVHLQINSASLRLIFDDLDLLVGIAQLYFAARGAPLVRVGLVEVRAPHAVAANHRLAEHVQPVGVHADADVAQVAHVDRRVGLHTA